MSELKGWQKTIQQLSEYEPKDYSATYNMGQEILRLESRIKELEAQTQDSKEATPAQPEQEKYQVSLLINAILKIAQKAGIAQNDITTIDGSTALQLAENVSEYLSAQPEQEPIKYPPLNMCDLKEPYPHDLIKSMPLPNYTKPATQGE